MEIKSTQKNRINEKFFILMMASVLTSALFPETAVAQLNSVREVRNTGESVVTDFTKNPNTIVSFVAVPYKLAYYETTYRIKIRYLYPEKKFKTNETSIAEPMYRALIVRNCPTGSAFPGAYVEENVKRTLLYDRANMGATIFARDIQWRKLTGEEIESNFAGVGAASGDAYRSGGDEKEGSFSIDFKNAKSEVIGCTFYAGYGENLYRATKDKTYSVITINEDLSATISSPKDPGQLQVLENLLRQVPVPVSVAPALQWKKVSDFRFCWVSCEGALEDLENKSCTNKGAKKASNRLCVEGTASECAGNKIIIQGSYDCN